MVPFNVPPRVRNVLYLICLYGSLVAGYLGTAGILEAKELALWSGFTAITAMVAKLNLGSSPQDVAVDAGKAGKL